MKIAVIADSLSWVQAQRVKDLRPYLAEFTLEVVKASDFACNIRTVPGLNYDGVWVASWRSVLAHPEILDVWPHANMLGSVGSHYNLGGGLKPETCFRKGTDPEEEFQKAIAILRQFKGVTCNSKVLETMLKPHLPDIILAQNGVDADVFSPGRRREFNPTNITVGWVGRTKAAKNYPMIRWAMAEASETVPIAFNDLALAKSARTPLGRSAMADYYRSLDFLVCGSFHEGFSNAVLEAAACGVPAITTEVGDHRLLVREGETGWFIAPTAESLIACVERLEHLEPWEYRRMSEAIRAEVEARWTWQRRVEPYRKALEEICGS